MKHGTGLLADCQRQCNIQCQFQGKAMIRTQIRRRHFLQAAGSLAAAIAVPSRLMAQAAANLSPIKLPPPISSAERLQRLARARALMAQNNIEAVVIEPGDSLDYYTGVQWW